MKQWLILCCFFRVVVCISLQRFLSFGMTNSSSDDSIGPITLNPSLEIFGRPQPSFHVNVSGVISLPDLFRADRLQHFPLSTTGTVVISPFWTDASAGFNGTIHYNNGTMDDITKVTKLFQESLGCTFTPTKVFFVTWENVTYNNASSDDLSERTNTFQCVLATSQQDTFILFLYADGLIQWARGCDNCGYAQVGVDGGDGVNYYSIPNSLTPEIINITHTSNVNTPGLWILKVDNNIITAPDTERPTSPIIMSFTTMNTEVPVTTENSTGRTESGATGVTVGVVIAFLVLIAATTTTVIITVMLYKHKKGEASLFCLRKRDHYEDMDYNNTPETPQKQELNVATSEKEGTDPYADIDYNAPNSPKAHTAEHAQLLETGTNQTGPYAEIDYDSPNDSKAHTGEHEQHSEISTLQANPYTEIDFNSQSTSNSSKLLQKPTKKQVHKMESGPENNRSSYEEIDYSLSIQMVDSSPLITKEEAHNYAEMDFNPPLNRGAGQTQTKAANSAHLDTDGDELYDDVRNHHNKLQLPQTDSAHLEADGDELYDDVRNHQSILQLAQTKAAHLDADVDELYDDVRNHQNILQLPQHHFAGSDNNGYEPIRTKISLNNTDETYGLLDVPQTQDTPNQQQNAELPVTFPKPKKAKKQEENLDAPTTLRKPLKISKLEEKPKSVEKLRNSEDDEEMPVALPKPKRQGLQGGSMETLMKLSKLKKAAPEKNVEMPITLPKQKKVGNQVNLEESPKTLPKLNRVAQQKKLKEMPTTLPKSRGADDQAHLEDDVESPTTFPKPNKQKTPKLSKPNKVDKPENWQESLKTPIPPTNPIGVSAQGIHEAIMEPPLTLQRVNRKKSLEDNRDSSMTLPKPIGIKKQLDLDIETPMTLPKPKKVNKHGNKEEDMIPMTLPKLKGVNKQLEHLDGEDTPMTLPKPKKVNQQRNEEENVTPKKVNKQGCEGGDMIPMTLPKPKAINKQLEDAPMTLPKLARANKQNNEEESVTPKKLNKHEDKEGDLIPMALPKPKGIDEHLEVEDTPMTLPKLKQAKKQKSEEENITPRKVNKHGSKEGDMIPMTLPNQKGINKQREHPEDENVPITLPKPKKTNQQGNQELTPKKVNKHEGKEGDMIPMTLQNPKRINKQLDHLDSEDTPMTLPKPKQANKQEGKKANKQGIGEEDLIPMTLPKPKGIDKQLKPLEVGDAPMTLPKLKQAKKQKNEEESVTPKKVKHGNEEGDMISMTLPKPKGINKQLDHSEDEDTPMTLPKPKKANQQENEEENVTPKTLPKPKETKNQALSTGCTVGYQQSSTTTKITSKKPFYVNYNVKSS